ncbi:DoxX family protein [Actinomadura fulvescens]|uniref:Integral membrane protein n=1 Tax=Actinomadura fulvescens TaxID=46160 RepID=A0ABN3PZ04_9ACTN
MFIAYSITGVLLAAVLSISATLLFRRNEQVAGDLVRMGVPEAWFPRLALLKLAGAVGLLAGLAVPAIGIAAAIGVILYFAGAVITHVRARDFALAPAVVLTVAAAVVLGLRVAAT